MIISMIISMIRLYIEMNIEMNIDLNIEMIIGMILEMKEGKSPKKGYFWQIDDNMQIKFLTSLCKKRDK